jgi:hypothetical protein
MELAKDDNLEKNKETLQDAGLSDGVIELCIAFLLAERSPKQPSVPADCGSLVPAGAVRYQTPHYGRSEQSDEMYSIVAKSKLCTREAARS